MMPQDSATRIRQASISQIPISVIFAGHGMMLGAWVTQVPVLRDRLYLSPGALGAALFFITAGALLTMPLTARLCARLGPEPIIQAGTVIAGSALILAAFATGYAWLCVALLVFGMGYGAVDVAMNAESVHVEHQAGRALLSSVHAMWSVGSCLGSAFGAILLANLPSSIEACILSGCATMGIFAAARGRLSPPHPVCAPATRVKHVSPWRDRRILAFGVLMCVAFGIEGGVADWGGIYLHAAHHLRPAYAAFGYSLFSACMVVMRFAGDHARRALGDTRALMGGFVAAAGILLVLAAPSSALAMAGFGVAGLGVANVVPSLFALAGRRGAEAVGVAATIGYAGVMAAPPVLGAIAQATSLASAIGMIGAFGCVIGAAAVWMKTHISD